MRKVLNFIVLIAFAAIGLFTSHQASGEKLSLGEHSITFVEVCEDIFAEFNDFSAYGRLSVDFAITAYIPMPNDRLFITVKHETLVLIKTYVCVYLLRCRAPPKIV